MGSSDGTDPDRHGSQDHECARSGDEAKDEEDNDVSTTRQRCTGDHGYEGRLRCIRSDEVVGARKRTHDADASLTSPLIREERQCECPDDSTGLE